MRSSQSYGPRDRYVVAPNGFEAAPFAGWSLSRALVQSRKRQQAGATWAGIEDRELDSLEFESAEGLEKALKVLSLLPHHVEVNGKDVPLKPALMDPGIYDGPEKYKISSTLQQRLIKVNCHSGNILEDVIQFWGLEKTQVYSPRIIRPGTIFDFIRSISTPYGYIKVAQCAFPASLKIYRGICSLNRLPRPGVVSN